MAEFFEPLTVLTEQFNRLPGIGKKTAQRLAYYILTQPMEYAEAFSKALLDAKSTIRYCKVCQNISASDICPICQNAQRDRHTVMVVKSPKEVIALERTNEFHGLYHVLHGEISPMDGISPEDLKIKELLERVSAEDVSEVVLMLSPTVEGDATSMYLARLLKPLGIRVTRIAQGLPMGSDIEYADEATLLMAFKERKEM
ncbi:MAG: recombination protein RecR [Clostridia bacterium]|nr:recombination protein RecR [Clostridia bacterium]